MRERLGQPAVRLDETFGWERYVGSHGRVIGMRTFGASAPLKELQRKFGFEPGQADRYRQTVARQSIELESCAPNIQVKFRLFHEASILGLVDPKSVVVRAVSGFR